MKRFRAFLFWCHLVTGIAVALVVIVMSATGVLLTYQRQLTAWADARGKNGAPPSEGMTRLPVETMLANVRRSVPGTPTAITWREDAEAPVVVAYGRERTVLVNVYTGVVLGEGSTTARRFFRAVTDWHRWLGASAARRPIGQRITGAANLGFLFLVVSGAYLWFPRNWTRRAVRNVALFRGGLRGKARDFNWHNVIGLWSLLPLGIVVASGVVLSFRWANALLYRSVGDQLPPASAAAPPPPTPPVNPARPGIRRAARLDGIDALLGKAVGRVPGWKSVTLTMPATDTTPAQFSVDRGTGGEPHKIAQLTLERGTGRILKWQPFAARTPGQRARAIVRFAHTGEVLGVFGQTLAGLVSLGGVLLAYTGLALSWRRYTHWRARRVRFADGRSKSAVRA